MAESRHVHAAHGAGEHDADFEVGHPVAQFAGVEKAAAVGCAGEPFAVFVFAFDAEHVVVQAAVFEEEAVAVKRGDDAEPAVVFYDGGGPAVEFFEVFAAFLVEDAFAV